MSGGGGGGSPIQTITGNDGIAVPPTANNIFLVGGTSTANNANGIATSGNAGTSTETVNLTNRAVGSVTTTGTGVLPLLTFPLGAIPGTYIFTTNIVAYNTTSVLSAGYQLVETVRTTGAVGVDIAPPDQIIVEEGEPGGMAQVAVTSGVSGNNYLITVAGYSGQIIDWNLLTTYIFVS